MCEISLLFRLSFLHARERWVLFILRRRRFCELSGDNGEGSGRERKGQTDVQVQSWPSRLTGSPRAEYVARFPRMVNTFWRGNSRPRFLERYGKSRRDNPLESRLKGSLKIKAPSLRIKSVKVVERASRFVWTLFGDARTLDLVVVAYESLVSRSPL